MPQPRIAMICSSPELGRRFEALASTRGLALEAHVAALEKALPLARDLAARGLADVIVACRGTAATVLPEILELMSGLLAAAKRDKYKI